MRLKKIIKKEIQNLKEDVSFPVWQRCVSRCPSVEGDLCSEGTMCKSNSDCQQSGEHGSDDCCKCKTFYKNPDKTDSAPDFYVEANKRLTEQDPDDTNDDWDLTDDTWLDDVVVTDTAETPITVTPMNIDYIPMDGDDDTTLPIPDDYEWVQPDDTDYSYIMSINCDQYGCMDPNAYNFNPDAGPWPFCSTLCHYNGPQDFYDQNYENESNHCMVVTEMMGYPFIPCYVNNGYNYVTNPTQYGQTIGQSEYNNYVVECCQMTYQSCHSLYGCVGPIQPGPTNIDISGIGNDDVPDEFQQCTNENSGCRNPSYANFDPDHFCDCDGNYIGPWVTGGFAGNTDCCSNDFAQYYPPECIEQILSLGYESGYGGEPVTGPDVGSYGLDPACWSGIYGDISNPYFTPADILYFYEYETQHPSNVDSGGPIVDYIPCNYGCMDPNAGNYDPDANCQGPGDCTYLTTTPTPDIERPEKPEVSLIRPEEPSTSDVKYPDPEEEDEVVKLDPEMPEEPKVEPEVEPEIEPEDEEETEDEKEIEDEKEKIKKLHEEINRYKELIK